MKQGSLRSSAYAVLTAFIWGTAFVAQSVGAEHVPPLAFNAARSVIAFVFLLVLCAVMRSGRRRKGQAASVTRSRKDLLLGGFWCGLTLGLASFLQQKGLDTTSPGKAGFITALYIVLVPIFGIFLKKRVPKAVWVSVLLAVTGTVLPVHHGELYHRPRRPLRDACAPLCLQHRSFWWITLSPWWTAWSCPAVSSSLSRRFP